MTSPSPFDDLPETRPGRTRSQQPLNEQENEIELSALWAGIRRYLPQVLGATALVALGLFLWSRSQPLVYQATSSLVTTGASTSPNNLQTNLVTANPMPQGALQEALQGPIVLGEIMKGLQADNQIPEAQRTAITRRLMTELQTQKLKTISLTSKLDYGNSGVYTVGAKGPTPLAATHLANLTTQALLNWDRSRALSGVRRAERAFQAQMAEIDRQLAEGKVNALERETLVTARATLQRNLTQAGIQAEGISGSLELVAPAVTPLKPVSPKPFRNAVLGALLTLLLGLAVAALKTALDRTARSEDDLLNFGLPTLGSIPRLRKRDVVFNGIVRAARQAGLYEAIGFLRVNLLSRLGTQTGKKIMITSTAPGEGKSSLTATLADGLASSGQRVLIVDADMRRGTQQEVWDKYEQQHEWVQLVGVGGARTLREALEVPQNVQVMQTEAGVHVLPAGPGFQDSLGLLNRVPLKEILDIWSPQYDVVLIDSPPLLAIADGLVLGKVMDAVLLVVEEGQTSLQAIGRSLRRAEQGHLKVLGFILNKVPPNSQENRSYGYSYGYSANTKS